MALSPKQGDQMKIKDGDSYRIRRSFGKIDKIIDIPNLIEIQKRSYDRFLQKDISPDDRKDFGLQGAFKSIFPIRDFSGTSSLEFIKYSYALLWHTDSHSGACLGLPVSIIDIFKLF